MINASKLEEYVEFVHGYMRRRSNSKFDMDELINICSGINGILLDWTGNTYVGVKKNQVAEKTYQKFFGLLYEFLLFCRDENNIRLTEEERTLGEYMSYQGTVYRYMGIHNSENIKRREKVYPEYNNIFVSWSKTKENSYMESKLHGPITWMKAEIDKPLFGIDINGFEEWCKKWFGESYYITRGQEKEVVFPTLKEYIVCMKILE